MKIATLISAFQAVGQSIRQSISNSLDAPLTPGAFFNISTIPTKNMNWKAPCTAPIDVEGLSEFMDSNILASDLWLPSAYDEAADSGLGAHLPLPAPSH